MNGLNMGNGYGIRNIEDCINYCKEKSYPYAGLQYALESIFFVHVEIPCSLFNHKCTVLKR